MLLDTQTANNTLTNTELLFNSTTKGLYEASIQKATFYIKQFLEREEFYTGEQKEDLAHKATLVNPNPNEPVPLEQALKELKTLYLDHAVSFHHPDYVAHLNCPVAIPALVGDMIASAVNTAVETWDQSTAATQIEQAMINWICAEFGFEPRTSDGVFTSGGTQSNFMALMIARDHYAFEHFHINLKENGWHKIVSKFRIFCSEKAHFSIKKNAALLGMGYQSVIPVATDAQLQMNPRALEIAIEAEQAKGNIPIAVVATTGTTDFGTFDPVGAIVEIAKKHQMWSHVDGAYGGCYILTDSHKALLKDVYKADSVTIDFHKSLFQPVCSSAFLLQEKSHFKYVSYYADYLNPLEARDEAHPDLIEKSIQTTRRFDALKLWFTIKVIGKKTLAGYLEKVHHLAKDAYDLVQENEFFETIHQPKLSTLVFRYIPPTAQDDKVIDAINLYVKNTLFNTGQASVASTKVDGRIYLKFTLLNPNSSKEHLASILDKIKNVAFLYNVRN